MNILITGAKGMVGTALTANLKNIRENKNRTRPDLAPGGEREIQEIYEYDIDSTAEELDEYCRKADFVFHLAGGEPSGESGGFHEGELWIYIPAAGESEETRE